MIGPLDLAEMAKRADGADVSALVAEVQRLHADLLRARVFAADARMALGKVLEYFDALDDDEDEAEETDEPVEVSPEEEDRRLALLDDAADLADGALAYDTPDETYAYHVRLVNALTCIADSHKRDRGDYIEIARDALGMDPRDPTRKLLLVKDGIIPRESDEVPAPAPASEPETVAPPP